MAQKSAGCSARGLHGSSEIQLEPKTDGVLLGDGLRRFRHGDKACKVEGRDSRGMPEDGGEVWHAGELEIYKIRLFHGIIAMFNLHSGE